MAYQAKRKQLYTEDFELTEEDGTVVHSLHVELDPDSMAVRLSEKHMDLVRALDDVKRCNGNTATEDGLEVVGRAVTDILEAVFGRDNAKIIAEFYNDRYFEMCREVMPFVTGVVIPEIRKMAQENKKTIAAGYNRKQRRMFGRK